MENIINVEVKAISLGEFNDFQTWIQNFDTFRQKYGLTAQFLHQDCNGFTTTGYDLRNFKNEAPYPVKTYLLIQDPEVPRPLPYKSISKN
ncbi:hypothetical protein RT99_06025 [Flavobacterium sp. MEB061]|uniref:hypothetical protein n=1 Tax=Flavobacterium sp. MEB061 TaxID=1587524 RepID=UPI0005ABD8E1|nr:hypothetical protein [Flavobacterium sp. MEB061]KIQ22660.1 hypothetical protein RT99_06025 [Flavobacterium sp. MEB061]